MISEGDRPSEVEAGGGPVSALANGGEPDYGHTVVRYGAMGWVGEFRYKRGLLSGRGGHVVVRTDRGIELGEQLALCCEGRTPCVSREQVARYVQNSGADFCRPAAGHILRQATAQDVDEHRRLNSHAAEDIAQCAAAAAQLGLEIKVVTVEHLLGGERIVFYFSAERRVDFRELVKMLARAYRTRIEMRQVGVRDEARLVADWEICGRECCCKGFLKNLRPVNMNMAKLQKSTLDPSKVSGRCGRLRCCLRYEHAGYQELAARLPRRGTRVVTPQGPGTVIGHEVLTQWVVIRTDDQAEYAVALEDIRNQTRDREEVTHADRPAPPTAAAPVEEPREREDAGGNDRPREEDTPPANRAAAAPSREPRQNRDRDIPPPANRAGPPGRPKPPTRQTARPAPPGRGTPVPPAPHSTPAGQESARGFGRRRRRRRRRPNPGDQPST